VSRLTRFQDYRFIGLRDTMRVYDCEVPEQFEELERRVTEEDLVRRKLVQSFAPDTLDEARNRGFKPVRVRVDQPAS
jgi:hypothetical protein